MPLYLLLWCGTGAIAASLATWQMVTRSRRIHSAMSDEMIAMAVRQFLPAVAAGLLLTVVLMYAVPQTAWLLPGLWQVLFSLGIFASCRFLPRAMMAAAVWYLGTGLACVALGDGRALAPWAMGVPFGVGQLLIAAVLLLPHPEGLPDA